MSSNERVREANRASNERVREADRAPAKRGRERGGSFLSEAGESEAIVWDLGEEADE